MRFGKGFTQRGCLTQATRCLHIISPIVTGISIIMQYKNMIHGYGAVVASCMIFFLMKTNHRLTAVFRLCEKSWYLPVGVLSHLVPGQATFANTSCISRSFGFLNIVGPISFFVKLVQHINCFSPKANFLSFYLCVVFLFIDVYYA